MYEIINNKIIYTYNDGSKIQELILARCDHHHREHQFCYCITKENLYVI
jgi:hypothetical protein